MLEITKVTKRFSSGAGAVTALNEVTMSVPQGSFATIIGKSGSGKSSLLSILGTLDRPTTGSIKVDDQEITTLSDAKLTEYRRHTIGFIFQSFNLIPNLSALENVMLPMEFTGVKTKDRLTRAKALLESVGLDESKQQRKPAKLSGGEQQRVAIARAMANRPKVILADEPTGNLDSQTGRTIVDLLRHLAQSEQTTIIAVTHDLALAKEADMNFHLADGTLRQQTAKEISASMKE
jgi:putative ABC transport system ATP-binding protein